MSDEELSSEWSVLEPTIRQRKRMEGRVFSWLAARETSLVAEWLTFLRFNPIAGLGFATASALSLVLVTPISWLSALVVS